ncbi:MAG: glycosyltransferase family 39 protein [Patescibacteria group bacterium]
MEKKTIIIGIILTILFLFIGLATLRDYGLTWDFHFHFFSGANFFGLKPADVEPRALPYVEPDPRNAIRLPYGPFVQIVPFASWLLFYKNLNILPYDVAYNLPIVIAGVLGISVLYFFLAEAINWRVGLVAALFLALTPRYFADLHNNMKDVPLAAVFALNIWMLWRLVKYRPASPELQRGGRLKNLILASLAFALAFNTKINSIFIPAIFACWLIVLRTKKSKFELLYFLFAPAAAFLLWWFFWGDPIGQLKLAVSTFGGGADNIEVLLGGKWFCAGSTVPWYYPYWYLAITTPLPILAFFLIGLMRLISQIRKNKVGLLLLLWFFLPLTRYLLPKIAVIDGVRHFEEVLYPLAAIAAIGFMQTIEFILKNTQISKKIRAVFTAILFSLVISHMSYIIFSYHPFQIAYYNELVGGTRGAFGNYDLDYWGSSQKKAVEWLNTNAEKNASVFIVMAGNVGGMYLRPDLLTHLNTQSYETSDYVIVLNRQSFFYRFFFVFDYILTHKPVHTVSVNGAPLVWIFDNRLPKIPRQTPWWKGEDPCIRKYW